MTEHEIAISCRTFELWLSVAARRDDEIGAVLSAISQTDDARQASAREMSC